MYLYILYIVYIILYIYIIFSNHQKDILLWQDLILKNQTSRQNVGQVGLFCFFSFPNHCFNFAYVFKDVVHLHIQG